MTAADRARLVADLERDEGVEALPYVDSVGKITIGCGRNLTDRGLSPDEIRYLLNNDIDETLADLGRAFPWWERLSPVRARVLANMCFNLGLPRLLGFKHFLSAVSREDYATAAAEMRRSKWYQQVGARAERLAVQMETGW